MINSASVVIADARIYIHTVKTGLFYFNITHSIANMDIQQIGELLTEILRRLQVLEAIHTQGQIADRRRQSLEDYRRAYYRQNGYSESTSNQDGEDEID